MQEYDVTLKLLMQKSARRTIEALTGVKIVRWLSFALPTVQNRLADLIGETADGRIIHVELQSTNDPKMPLRMGEYCLGIVRFFDKFPDQILLYVGNEPLRMDDGLRGGRCSIEYQAIDIRDLDGESLLASDEVGDNVIAILTRFRDQKTAIRRIVEKIAGLEADEREIALSHFLILAGLRRLEETVEQEVRKVPVFIDISENKVLGPAYKRGMQDGRQEGHQEGEREILRRQLKKRFGDLPNSVEEWLSKQSAPELEELSERLLDAKSLEEIVK